MNSGRIEQSYGSENQEHLMTSSLEWNGGERHLGLDNVTGPQSDRIQRNVPIKVALS
jgi:hypothetical protein